MRLHFLVQLKLYSRHLYYDMNWKLSIWNLLFVFLCLLVQENMLMLKFWSTLLILHYVGVKQVIKPQWRRNNRVSCFQDMFYYGSYERNYITIAFDSIQIFQNFTSSTLDGGGISVLQGINSNFQIILLLFFLFHLDFFRNSQVQYWMVLHGINNKFLIYFIFIFKKYNIICQELLRRCLNCNLFDSWSLHVDDPYP